MTVFEQVKQQVITQFKLKNVDIKESTNLFDDLDFDSLDAVELVIELEELYKIELLDKEAEGIKTMRDIVALIESKR